MFTKQFWSGAGERAIKTFVQTLFAAFATVVAGATTAWDVPWLETGYDAAGVALLAAIASLVTSIGNVEFTKGSPKSVVQGVGDDEDFDEPGDGDE